MDTENLLSALERVHPLSVGLRAYLSKIVTARYFSKDQQLQLTTQELDYLPFLLQGSTRLCYLDSPDKTEATLAYFFTDDLLPDLTYLPSDVKTKFYFHFMEDTIIQSISQRHILNILKLFSDARSLILSLSSHYLAFLFIQLYARNHLKSKQRYLFILSQQPEIDEIVKIKSISNFLGIDVKTLSRIRSSPFKK